MEVTRRNPTAQKLLCALLSLQGAELKVRVYSVHAHPDVGVLVVPGKIQHVIQGQHAWRNLGEIHSWIHMVLRDRGGGR